ncbi:zinc metalloproteinase nas-8-like [Photinus pyralis]|uniref:zinc metalloproteinase nas-8-like n=1 Tax=Photinus pyralis TaxID=7054 RepID=UPI0012676DBF|nr:zinc metalloproteinase nas-8-like [Photinus pyralis]
MKISLCILLIGLRSLYAVPINSELQKKYFDINTSPWQYSGKFEGDMLFSNRRNGVTNLNLRWPYGRVCYYIAPSFTSAQQNRIRDTLRNAFVGTCLQAVENWQDCNGDYVYFKNDQGGCYSHVGRIGGGQTLNLGGGCADYENVILHEFMHAVGFQHEHSSPDRDNYIWILYENIVDDQYGSFNKIQDVTPFGQPYDLCTIMHYTEYAFSKNNQPTIVAKSVSRQHS